MERKRKEKISKKVLDHSSLGEFNNDNLPTKGGHGEENIRELNRRGIVYNVEKTYPNGVRAGNMPSHKQPFRRQGEIHSWFPSNWTRNTIKKAGEKVINSTNQKQEKTVGKYKKVKVVVVRDNDKIATVYPSNIQTGGKNNGHKKRI